MSLHDIIMDRALIEFRNEQGGKFLNLPPNTLFSSIADTVVSRIQKEQAALREQRMKEQNFEESLRKWDEFEKRTEGKIGRLIPSAKITKDGILEVTASSEHPSTRASRVKSELEIKQIEKQNKIIDDFFSSEDVTVTDLIRAGIKPNEAEKMEELRVPVLQQRQQLRETYDTQFDDLGQALDRESVSISPTSGDIVATKFSPAGRPKEYTDIGAQTKIDTAKADVQVQKEVASEAGKAASLSERDFLRANATVDTSFDMAINFAEKQMEMFGTRPGEFLGIIDRLTPSQVNQYRAAFLGAGRESAALIARMLIPGVRAANITRIFSKSTAELGNTIEGNASNIAASLGNAFANILSQNVKEVDVETGKTVNIQDITIDKRTNKPLSQLSVTERSRAINDLKREFIISLEEDYLMRVYKRNPELLQPATRRNIDEKVDSNRFRNMSDEELLQRIEELRRK